MPGLRPPKEDLIKQLPLETERKVLRITIGFTLLASLILIIAIATDYWLILTVLGKPHTMQSGNKLLGSHSGLWRSCLDIKVVDESGDGSEIISNCTNLFDLIEDAEKAKKQKNTISGGPGVLLAYAKSYVAFAFVSLFFLLLAHIFAIWAQANMRYVIKRTTACLMAITSICVLVAIQVLENSTETKEQYTKKIEHLDKQMLSRSYGFSYVMAWIPVVVFLGGALVFLITSKKRMGHDIDADIVLDDVNAHSVI